MMEVTVKVELLINDSVNTDSRYLCWSPSPCAVRLLDPEGASLPIKVRLRNKPGGTGGKVAFRLAAASAASATLSLDLPAAGVKVPFFMAGVFGKASKADRDAIVEVRSGTAAVGQVELMVRIRKNANKLSPAERDRFVAALATLNNQGTGRFAEFRDMHTNTSSPQAHGEPGFLPWHRAYLLDLERELQAIDASVALPYWRFDQAAPRLFTRDFVGVANSTGTVQFAATNPLQFWRTDGIPGVNRRPRPPFNPATGGATLLNEMQTLALGQAYIDFIQLEGDPHGLAHSHFGGFIGSIHTAARDPLFFLLHANVDRLWAKWQRQNLRFDPAVAAAFDRNAPAGNSAGHNLADTMWPWNGITGGTRPPTAPGGGLAASPCTPAPGSQPRVRDGLDYQGTVSPASRLGFDYDDVPFA
jgi:tyrosinase